MNLTVLVCCLCVRVCVLCALQVLSLVSLALRAGWHALGLQCTTALQRPHVGLQVAKLGMISVSELTFQIFQAKDARIGEGAI